MLPLYLVILSIGAINALVPIIIIIILIAAAAGATRGFSLFNVFGIASIIGGGIGSVGGSSRGSAAKAGFPLRLLLDPAPKGVKDKNITKIRMTRTPAGSTPARNVVGRWREITARGRERVTRLNIREGERQLVIRRAGIGGGVRPVVIRNSPGWVKMAFAAVPAAGATVLGLKNSAAAFNPKPMNVEKTRMQKEKEEIDKNIAKITRGTTAEKLFRSAAVKMRLTEHLRKKLKIAESVGNREMAERIGNMMRRTDSLIAEANVIYPGIAGLQKRKELITEQENVIGEATRKLREGSMSDEEHRRVFASAMTRLYGPPDNSVFHRVLNPYYGTSAAYGGARISNIKNTVARVGEDARTAGSVAGYLKAGAAASLRTGFRQMGVLTAARLVGDKELRIDSKSGKEIARGRRNGEKVVEESEKANRLMYELMPEKDPKLGSAIGKRFAAYRKAHWDVNAAHEKYRENAYDYKWLSAGYEKEVIKSNAPKEPAIRRRRTKMAVDNKDGPK